jgi:hypothetical protein
MNARTPSAPAAPRPSNWAAYAACAWAFLFAIPSFYWAAGGTLGLGTLSPEIRRLTAAQDPGFIALVWVTGVLKVAAGVLALALVQPWGRAIPRWMLRLGAWGTGVLLTLYGGVGFVQAMGVLTGLIETATPVDRTPLRWYAFLWEPYWLVGGLLFLATAWIYERGVRLGRRGGVVLEGEQGGGAA